jgi:cob(I)alamin adenosyltransferase
MRSKVTTKKGDQGTTRLLSGETVSKAHPIVECTGQVDKVRAHIALLRHQILTGQAPGAETHADFLFWVLHCCFLMGTEVNDPRCTHPEYRKGEIGAAHLQKLETQQEQLESNLEMPREFIVSAANLLSAQADVCATLVRDLERALVRLKESIPEFKAELLLAFTNRLSDYCFILARTLDDDDFTVVDYEKLLD